jgi:hypothetical protein
MAALMVFFVTIEALKKNHKNKKKQQKNIRATVLQLGIYKNFVYYYFPKCCG